MIDLRPPRRLEGTGDYRVVKWRPRQDQTVHAVMDTSCGRILTPAELVRLADATVPECVEPSRRRLSAVFVDESPLRGVALESGWRGVVLDALDVPAVVPLLFRNDDLVIGGVDRVALCLDDAGLPGAVGRALVGRAWLNGSRLADVAWRALDEGILSGLCVVFRHQHQDAEGRLCALQIEALRLVAPEDACSPGTRVLRRWTAPRAARLEGLTDEELAAVETALGQPLPALDDGPAFTLTPMPTHAALAELDDEEKPSCR